MIIEEYKKRLAEINKEYDNAMIALNAQAQRENNPYKVGDVIEDHIGKGRIKKIVINNTRGEYDYRFHCLLPVYICDNLTRKGEINKREPERVIYGCDVILNNKELYLPMK